jgi:SulP family sulfate permease
MTAIDSTGRQALKKLAHLVHAYDRQLILCGAREQPAKRLREAKCHDYLGSANICRSVAEALNRAKIMRAENSQQHSSGTPDSG